MKKFYPNFSMPHALTLVLVLAFFSPNLSFGQTTLINYGFETNSATWTYNLSTGYLNGRQNNNSNTGSWSNGIFANSGNNKTYIGSTATPVINFINGKYYSISVRAKIASCSGILKITKANGNSHTSLNGATGSDILLNNSNSYNVTSTTYNLFSTTFQATTTESKYVGFIMASSGCSGVGSGFSSMFLDDIRIIESDTPFYCTPSSSSTAHYINSVISKGTLSDNSNLSTGYTTGGYGNFSNISIATQIPGGGINMDVNLVNGQYLRAYVDWNKDGDFTDTDEDVYTSNNTYFSGTTTFGIIIPPSQTPGNYRLRIVGSENTPANSCTITNNGEAEDYTIVIVADCPAKITSVTNNSVCGSNSSMSLSVTGSAGTTSYKWYTTKTGGTAITGATSSTYTTPALTNTTTYYVTALNGSCESWYRTPVTATIKPTTNITVTPTSPTTCIENNIISITAAGDTVTDEILTQDFESGLAPFTITTTTNNTGEDIPWSVKTSPYQPKTTSVWKPAINSGSIGSIGNKFAFTTSDYNGSTIQTIITSPIIDPSTYSSLTLSFDQYYSNYSGDTASLQVSINGGAWNNVVTYTSEIGTPSIFNSESINLNTYASSTNTQLQFRFVYTASFDNGWAIDNIKLTGIKPLNTTFTWSGASIDAYINNTPPLIPYTNQSVSTIYILPNSSQIEQASWSFTATTTLGNGCPVSKVINVTNNARTWKGTNSNDWNDPGNWIPNGVPTSDNCVIISDNAKITGSNQTAYGKNLTVKSTGSLELLANNNLIINDWIDIKTGGNFNIRNNANLVQINDTPSQPNSGTLKIDRTATNLKLYDYIYWSSPVESFNTNNVSPLTSSSKIYHWVPDHYNGNGYGYGNWLNINENMEAGKGYIIRVPNANPSFTTTFTGKPQNGIITKTLKRGPYTGSPYTGTNNVVITNEDDNWNLIGNPYPSAIDAIEFLTANSGIIAGQVNLWTHSSAISNTTANPYYGSFGYNYKSSDYVTYNSSGNNIGPTGGFNGKIAAGQGFFVKMIDGAASTGSITFNNGMRSDASNNAYNNGQFYKTSDITKTEPEKHRIWLDLLDSNLNTSRFMIGYIEGATNAKDNLYDATTNYKESLKAFSLIDDEVFVIQGRSLPFDKNDKVNFGYQVPTNGTYKISISDVDGLFKTTGQKIYIEDLLTNTTHDLTLTPYSFNSDKGSYKNRFIIKFDDQRLSNNDNEFSNSVIVFGKDQLTIKSELFNIKNVTVYDILGKTLLNEKDIAGKEYNAVNLRNTNTAVLVKITLENGTLVTKKVIF